MAEIQDLNDNAIPKVAIDTNIYFKLLDIAKDFENLEGDKLVEEKLDELISEQSNICDIDKAKILKNLVIEKDGELRQIIGDEKIVKLMYQFSMSDTVESQKYRDQSLTIELFEKMPNQEKIAVLTCMEHKDFQMLMLDIERKGEIKLSNNLINEFEQHYSLLCDYQMFQMALHNELELCITPTVQHELMAHIKEITRKSHIKPMFSLQEFVELSKYFSFIEMDRECVNMAVALSHYYMGAEPVAQGSKNLRNVGISVDFIDKEPKFYKAQKPLFDKWNGILEVEGHKPTDFGYKDVIYRYDINGGLAVSSERNANGEYGDAQIMAEANILGLHLVTHNKQDLIDDYYDYKHRKNEGVRKHVRWINNVFSYQSKLSPDKEIHATQTVAITPYECMKILQDDEQCQKLYLTPEQDKALIRTTCDDEMINKMKKDYNAVVAKNRIF